MDNYINAFEYRHMQMKDIWHLDYEIVEAAKYLMMECGYEGIENRDAFLDYDNLAINAEIVAKDEAMEQYGKSWQELASDALFTTQNYVCLSW